MSTQAFSNESIQVSLQHITKSLDELHNDYKLLMADVVILKVAIASLKGTTGERNKVGDWLMSALISGLTAFGVAKLFLGAATGQGK